MEDNQENTKLENQQKVIMSQVIENRETINKLTQTFNESFAAVDIAALISYLSWKEGKLVGAEALTVKNLEQARKDFIELLQSPELAKADEKLRLASGARVIDEVKDELDEVIKTNESYLTKKDIRTLKDAYKKLKAGKKAKSVADLEAEFEAYRNATSPIINEAIKARVEAEQKEELAEIKEEHEKESEEK